jgi:hypothetical protein
MDEVFVMINGERHYLWLTGHRMPRCSFPEADINWSSNFSIHKRLSMHSCTTRTLHVSRAIAILGYAAQVSVRVGSVIAHLASLNKDGPKRPFSHTKQCCGAARHCSHSCRAQHLIRINRRCADRLKLPSSSHFGRVLPFCLNSCETSRIFS